MQQGLLGRISRTSIMEYHAFGIISTGRTSGEHFMICGVQGDFTKSLVDNPPKTLWTRELKFGRRFDLPPMGSKTCSSLNKPQPVLATPPQCSNAAFASVPEPASAPHSPPAYRAKTGSSSGLARTRNARSDPRYQASSTTTLSRSA